MRENYLLKMLNQLANSKLIKRWQPESPDFWKGVQKYSIVIGSGAVAIISADKLFGLIAYGVPAGIFTACGYIIVACAAFGLSAKITTK